MKKIFVILLIFLFVNGCNPVDKTDDSFIFTYALNSNAYNSIEKEHKEKIDEWLLEAKENNDERIYEYSLEGYQYYYAKGFKDAEVSFVYRGRSKKGELKTTLSQGEKGDSVFVRIKYNSDLCCGGTGIEIVDHRTNTEDASMFHFTNLNDVQAIEVTINDNTYNIEDRKMISDMISMLEESQPLTDEYDISKIREMSKDPNHKLVLVGGNQPIQEFSFVFDTLYEVGYVETDQKRYVPDYSFFRYIDDLGTYKNPDTRIDRQVQELFDKYNWTVDYKINTLTETLPMNLKHRAGEYPVKIYWGYNLELSKEIGLDFSTYLGKEIEVEVYRLREPLPDFLKPRRNARGIVLKYHGELIGTYIDAGRHDSFACSLNRKRLQEITGKNWDEWITDYIDYDDDLEKKLSEMEPEEIITAYFKALDEQDLTMLRACLTRKNLIGELSVNMDSEQLFNIDRKPDYNIKHAKLLSIKEVEGIQNEPGMLEYMVEVDFDFKKQITSNDGIAPRFVLIKKEAEKSGWRIDGIGTGP